MKIYTPGLLALLVGLFAIAINAEEIPDVPIQATSGGTEPKPEGYRTPGLPPEPGKQIRKVAEDSPGKPQMNFGVLFTNDNESFFRLITDRLEHRSDDQKDLALWDIDVWYGTDLNKLYVELEGEWDTDRGSPEISTNELFWNHTIRSFWDTQLGVRYDSIIDKDNRKFLAAGIQGMAPYIFEMELTSYMSEDGDFSVVLELERDFYFSQRIVLQPRIESEASFSDVPEYNIGSGLTSIETGLRLRYQISRKFAPYIGVSWERKLGETADLFRASGKDTKNTFFLIGIKFWL